MTLELGGIKFDHVVYDPEGDVLYLSVGSPREAASQVATEDGHLVRFDEGGNVIGVALVNAKWLMERDGQLRIDLPYRVDPQDLAPALA